MTLPLTPGSSARGLHVLCARLPLPNPDTPTSALQCRHRQSAVGSPPYNARSQGWLQVQWVQIIVAQHSEAASAASPLPSKSVVGQPWSAIRSGTFAPWALRIGGDCGDGIASVKPAHCLELFREGLRTVTQFVAIGLSSAFPSAIWAECAEIARKRRCLT
jgi:hypothetical protein